MALKPLTARRAILELALAYTLILLVIWTPHPWQRIFYIAAVIALAAILAFSFQSPRALGLRRTNLLRSLWVAIVALILSSVIILAAAHLHTLRAPHSVSGFIARYWGYALWAFVQQILLQDVFLRRLLILIPSKPRLAALAAATALRPRASAQPHPHAHHIRLGIHLLPALPPLPQHHPARHRTRRLRHHAGHHHPSTTHPQHACRSRLPRVSPQHHRSHIDHTVSTNVCVTADAPTRLS